jgi:uncharacterized protein YaeQ
VCSDKGVETGYPDVSFLRRGCNQVQRFKIITVEYRKRAVFCVTRRQISSTKNFRIFSYTNFFDALDWNCQKKKKENIFA